MKDNKGLTPEKKEQLKGIMGSCLSPISWSLVSMDAREEERMKNIMTNKNKVINIDKKQEEKLFDNHMNTMFDLVDELLERENNDEELSEAEIAFLDAFMEYNEFLVGEEE